MNLYTNKIDVLIAAIIGVVAGTLARRSTDFAEQGRVRMRLLLADLLLIPLNILVSFEIALHAAEDTSTAAVVAAGVAILGDRLLMLLKSFAENVIRVRTGLAMPKEKEKEKDDVDNPSA